MLRSISRLARMSLVATVVALGACVDREPPTGIEYPMPAPPQPPQNTPFAIDGKYQAGVSIRTANTDASSASGITPSDVKFSQGAR